MSQKTQTKVTTTVITSQVTTNKMQSKAVKEPVFPVPKTEAVEAQGQFNPNGDLDEQEDNTTLLSN